MKDSEAKVGDIIESPDGSCYLVLPAGYRTYIGNIDFEASNTSTFFRAKSDVEFKKIGSVAALKRREDGP